jgi:hypothetical protein
LSEHPAAPEPITGSTTIVDLLRRFPGGEAAELMGRLAWPCAHCSGAMNEPISMAAKRHANRAGPVVRAFQALAHGGPTEAEITVAAQKTDKSKDPAALWARYAR